MKKIILILGGLALLMVSAVVGICFYWIHKTEKEENTRKTAPARAARWQKNGSVEDPKIESEIKDPTT